MGCTCPPPGDKGRGEFVLTRERWSSNANALSLHGFFLLPEKRSKYFLLELQDMFQQFHVDHSLDIKCLTNGHKKAQ